MPSAKDSGVELITDNWLLQSAAEALGGGIRAEVETKVLDLDADQATYRPTPYAAIQIASVASLLEQIVFAGRLLVMTGWTDAWSGKVPDLDALAGTLISEFDATDDAFLAVQDDFNREFCAFKPLKLEHADSMTALSRGAPSLAGQLINGTSAYLAASVLFEHAYWPHPSRARLLAQTLVPRQRNALFDKIDEETHKTRARLARAIGGERRVQSVAYQLPSVALLCMAEAQRPEDCIRIALQLRQEKEVASLRTAIKKTSGAIGNDWESLKDVATELDEAITEVHRRLKLHTDGESDLQITAGIVSAAMPSFKGLKRPLIAPRYTTLLQRMVELNGATVEQILLKVFGVKNKSVFQALKTM